MKGYLKLFASTGILSSVTICSYAFCGFEVTVLVMVALIVALLIDIRRR